VLGAIGRVFIAIGLLLFGFAAYQVWGTGIQEARSQSALEKEFDELTKSAPSVVATTAASTTTTAPPTTTAADTSTTAVATTTTEAPATTTTLAEDPALASLLDAKDGDSIARLEIPRIGLKKIVVSGVSVDDLRRGPGHYRNTAQPGQNGNAAIAAHRTAYGSPFKDVDKLEPGDEIIVSNKLKERFVYKVRSTTIVDPSDISVLAPSDEAILTLTSCHPLYTAQQRIIVTAELDRDATNAPIRPATPITDKPDLRLPSEPIDPAVTSVPGKTATSAATSSSDPTTTVADPADLEAGADAFAKGWFSDKNAPPQVALWGVVLSAVALGAWQLSKRTKRNLIGFGVGVVPFLFVLYFFYENVNRLLPPSI
jgi:sortase A